MIENIKIPEKWAAEIAQNISGGMRTNFYISTQTLFPFIEEGRDTCQRFPGGSYFFVEGEKQIDLYFFLEKEKKLQRLPDFPKPVVLEQVAMEKADVSPTAEEWQAIGFQPYLKRRRLFLSAKNAPVEQREILFGNETDLPEIIDLMQESFEPYTSALPDAETLRKDLREGRVIVAKENGILLGFLRFGREKKVSVLWQIAVPKVGQGKGVGSALVRDWLALERAEVTKFQLWVREDNPSAWRMYEKQGFLPDGRMAPVMIKKKGL